MIGKKLFLQTIDEIRAATKYQDGLNGFFRENNCDGYLLQPDCVDTVIRLLENIFCDTKDNWISYFCWELDFGGGYEPGSVIAPGGENIELRTAEDLYDLLVDNMQADGKE